MTTRRKLGFVDHEYTVSFRSVPHSWPWRLLLARELRGALDLEFETDSVRE